jgi:hypothetical protein
LLLQRRLFQNILALRLRENNLRDCKSFPQGLPFFVVFNVNNLKMRFIDVLCPPALLYLLYVVIQVGLDISLGLWVTAAVKIVGGLAGTIILDTLCGVELGVVSWAIVATPFLMTAAATTISLGLGIDRMAAKFVQEKFTPLTADNKKNRDIYVTQLKQQDALPLSSSSMY